MIIVLYNNTSENIEMFKSITQLTQLEGTLKSDVSILSPSIEVSGIDSIVNQVNYCFIPDFNRFYFVTNIIITGKNLVTLELDVDVLMSHAAQIVENYAVIERQEYVYNMQLRDVNIPTYNQTQIEYINFPTSFTDFSLIIPILGN